MMKKENMSESKSLESLCDVNPRSSTYLTHNGVKSVLKRLSNFHAPLHALMDQKVISEEVLECQSKLCMDNGFYHKQRELLF